MLNREQRYQPRRQCRKRREEEARDALGGDAEQL